MICAHIMQLAGVFEFCRQDPEATVNFYWNKPWATFCPSLLTGKGVEPSTSVMPSAIAPKQHMKSVPWPFQAAIEIRVKKECIVQGVSGSSQAAIWNYSQKRGKNSFQGVLEIAREDMDSIYGMESMVWQKLVKDTSILLNVAGRLLKLRLETLEAIRENAVQLWSLIYDSYGASVLGKHNVHIPSEKRSPINWCFISETHLADLMESCQLSPLLCRLKEQPGEQVTYKRNCSHDFFFIQGKSFTCFRKDKRHRYAIRSYLETLATLLS